MDNLHVKYNWTSNGQVMKIRTFCAEKGEFTLISMSWKNGNGSLESDYRGDCDKCDQIVAFSAMDDSSDKECNTGKCGIPNKANFHTHVVLIRPHPCGVGTEQSYSDVYTCTRHTDINLYKILKADDVDGWDITDYTQTKLR